MVADTEYYDLVCRTSHPARSTRRLQERLGNAVHVTNVLFPPINARSSASNPMPMIPR